MPLIFLTRLLTSLVSWGLLAAIVYLGWTYYQGDFHVDADGNLYRLRETWRLWALLALLVWSVVGGRILLPVLSARDKRRLDTNRAQGRVIGGADGARLYIEAHGHPQAPTLILTHGWGLDSTIWSYAKEDLCVGYQVLVWDLPGMGLSKPGIDGISLPAFAANLKHLIEQETTGKVILVGHSIGGMTVQTLARDYPDFFEANVAGAVLLNTTHINPLRTMIVSKLALALQRPLIEPLMRLTRWLTPLAWLNAWQAYFNGNAHLANRIGFGPEVTHAQLEHTALLSTRNAPGAQALGNLSMFHWDATGAFRHLPVPVLVIGGEMDLVTLPGASVTIASDADLAQLTLVETANHMGFLECWPTYNDAMLQFARRYLPPVAKSLGHADLPARQS